ncbi:carbohydrate sulfotransferase 4-like isoform X1 [Macrobrachium rosenbergii]|uniref:carbohydrate sulfotransferase 4-like isoform X1 n=1 Tax=Macrobrachium rosenbergii TaxID=79674 RepID=UPI0034D5E3E7
MTAKMRIKHKRPLALALVVTVINLLIFFYGEYTANISADILRRPAIFDKLGPGLPPEDTEEAKKDLETILLLSNATLFRNTSQISDGELKSKSATNRFLIHSYLKSGASKVAEALNLHHKEIFYVHHPLQALDKDNPSSGLSVVTNKLGTQGMNWLKAIYNCSFQNNKQVISEPEIWKSHSIRVTYRKECQHLKLPVEECLERACRARSLRAVFTVRLGIDFIYQMMKSYGNKFKVIFVVRDPRSILSNRRHRKLVPLKTSEEFKKQASKLCKAMGSDMLYAEQIKKILPESILILHYEHFVLYPRTMLSYLYKFLGLEVPEARIQEVIAILGLQVPEDQRLQMTKNWQIELTLLESRSVDYGCKFYYKMLGYFPVPSKLAAYDKYFVGLDQQEYTNFTNYDEYP